MLDAAEFFKALPPGARWITVRPNGPGTEGHPVLIQPAGDGAYHVIGGAGGKLNFLKLRNVKSEADYKQEAAASAVARREEKKRLRERDRENGLHESKQRARRALRDALYAEQAKFVETVATATGSASRARRLRRRYSSAATTTSRSRPLRVMATGSVSALS